MKIKKQITRRGFITNTALAGIGTIGAANLLNSCTAKNSGKVTKDETDHHEYNHYYSGRHLDRIAFPIGGIRSRHVLSGRSRWYFAYVSTKSS